MEKRYNVADALKILLLPDGISSDIEDEETVDDEVDLINGDQDKEPSIPDHVGELDVEVQVSIDNKDKDIFSPLLANESSVQAAENATGTERRKKSASHYKWRKAEVDPVDTTFHGKFSDPPPSIPTPYTYFKGFINDACMESIANQTNIYAMQRDGKTLDVSKGEIEQFIGILLYTGVYSCSSYRMYWETNSRFPLVADIMTRNRFESLLKYIHFADNTHAKPRDHLEYDPLFKVRPLLEALRAKMLEIEPEERNSIDEQIIPFKGRSSLKQYNKNKPHKWGYKVFTRAGVSGIMYDFEVYTGKRMNLSGQFGVSGNVVMRMVERLPKGENFKVYFDNWFSSADLVKELQCVKIWSVATIRQNRMSGCMLKDDKALKKEGRGSFDYRCDALSGISIVKWHDNKSVHLISSYCGTEPLSTCKRWSREEKKHIHVPMPRIVKEYNLHMGGVDLADMLIELYRIDVKSKKWYSKIAHFCFDVAVVNSWLLYRRHMTQLQEKKVLSLKDFRCSIASALTRAGKPLGKKRGRPSLEENTTKVKHSRLEVAPVADVRYDNMEHWPSHTEKKVRCKLCCTGYTRVKCQKCSVGLCLNKRKNCFLTFHKK